jgi:hypothetical protein
METVDIQHPVNQKNSLNLSSTYFDIIKKAWEGYDASKTIRSIEDISAMVSTNHVYSITFDDDDIIIAKLSNFGKYEHFKEDHRIIHSLSNNLLYPFENLLAKSLLKNNRVYIYRHKHAKTDVWVVFYNPTRIMDRMPRRLDEHHICKLGQQIGKFHKACSRVKNVLPKSSKTLRTDIYALQQQLELKEKKFGSPMQVDFLKYHCDLFLKNRSNYNMKSFETIPVFIDWNIGNFSVTPNLELYSRWDYDWFRMSYRMLDFYFFSRVVSDVGDRTVFSYVINYVIKDGKYFFNEQYAKKLQAEAFDIYLPSVDRDFDADKIISALNLK